MKGNRNYFHALRTTHGDRVKHYENGEGKIWYPKSHNFHLGHVAAFVTSYTRMNVLEQLLAIDPRRLVRVCVDGIYHTQANVELKNVFRTKHELRFENLAGLSFVDQARERDLCPPVEQLRVHYGKELHLGGGGCGKTYVNLTDGGLVRPLYLAPSWKLSRAKQNETEELGNPINGSVWNQALSADPEKVNRIRKYYNTLVIGQR